MVGYVQVDLVLLLICCICKDEELEDFDNMWNKIRKNILKTQDKDGKLDVSNKLRRGSSFKTLHFFRQGHIFNTVKDFITLCINTIRYHIRTYTALKILNHWKFTPCLDLYLGFQDLTSPNCRVVLVVRHDTCQKARNTKTLSTNEALPELSNMLVEYVWSHYTLKVLIRFRYVFPALLSLRLIFY